MASMHQQTGKKGEEIQNKHAEMIGAQAKRQDRNRKKKKKYYTTTAFRNVTDVVQPIAEHC